MTSMDQLLSEIETFLERHDMAPTKFGTLAMNDAKFVGRLRAGQRVRLDTADRVRDFMRSYGRVGNRRQCA